MSATSWRYFTSYCADPEVALQSLRDRVFARRKYVDLAGPLEDALRHTAKRFGRDADSPEVRAEIENDLRVQRAVQTGDAHGLTRADRALVHRLRAVGHMASQLGAERPAPSGEAPGSIVELLERAAECGTHSILDIEHTATLPGFGIAVAMSDASIRQAFGSVEPTHDEVELGWPDVAETLGRWQACYVTVYRHGEPSEYAFIGCSGD